MIVAKFGGTSVKDSDAISRVLDIIKTIVTKRVKIIVVLSACSGMTDKLLSLIENAPGNEYSTSKNIIDDIIRHHLKICKSLIKDRVLLEKAEIEVSTLGNELLEFIEGVCLLNEVTPRSIDRAVSFGELFSTLVFHHAALDLDLNSYLWNAGNFMRTDDSFTFAKPDFGTSAELITEQYKKISANHDVIVTQGYIASDGYNHTTTLGRGGSDYSAAIIGSALKADEIQIWTDVPGVLSADPRIVPNTVTIPIMSYNEIRLLSFFGAKVLHPDTIKPAIDAGVPIRILNTFQPEHPGTLILQSAGQSESSFNSIVLKENCLLMNFDIPGNDSAAFNYSRIQKFIEDAGIKLYHSEQIVDSMLFLVENNINDDLIYYLQNNLSCHSLKKADIIFIAGNRGSSFTKFDREEFLKFTTELINNDSISIKFNRESSSLLAILPEGKGKIAYLKIHELLLD
jgi:aspartate kinase